MGSPASSMTPYTNPRALQASIILSMWRRTPSCARSIAFRRHRTSGFSSSLSAPAAGGASGLDGAAPPVRPSSLLSSIWSFHMRRFRSEISMGSEPDSESLNSSCCSSS